jgi:hypothetical protein
VLPAARSGSRRGYLLRGGREQRCEALEASFSYFSQELGPEQAEEVVEEKAMESVLGAHNQLAGAGRRAQAARRPQRWREIASGGRLLLATP